MRPTARNAAPTALEGTPATRVTTPKPATTRVSTPEHEREYRQCARAAVEDQHPAAVIGDDEPARVGQCPGRCCVHVLQRASRRGRACADPQSWPACRPGGTQTPSVTACRPAVSAYAAAPR